MTSFNKARKGKVSGWKKTGTLGESIYWESKKRSKTYKGQADQNLALRRHPLNKTLWTVEHGQAPISMPYFKTRAEAFGYAQKYMKRYP